MQSHSYSRKEQLRRHQRHSLSRSNEISQPLFHKFLLPILVFMWIVPYTNPEFLTSHSLVNGITLYVFLICIFSTIIQFFIGAPFYSGSYRAVRGGAANMDVLVVLGTSSAWIYGVILIFMKI
jgi:cation transport ATPase